MEDQWSKLPKDILELISKKIISIEDYLRIRAVCIPWRSALSPNPFYLPPLSPWLMLPYGTNDGSYRLFYDISSSNVRIINLPETCGKDYCGSSKGWLMLQDGPEYSLFNPITKVLINLPSLESPPKVLGVENTQSLNDIMSRLDIWSGSRTIIVRAILTSNPTLDPNCIVMVVLHNNWKLAFCRIGDKSWTILEAPKEKGERHNLDAIFHNELFYSLHNDEVTIYNRDLSKKEVLKIIEPMSYTSLRLLEGNFNELMLVAEHDVTRNGFSVFKLGTEDGQPSWIEVGGIGERTCFICSSIEQFFTFEGLSGYSFYYAYPKYQESIHRGRFQWYKAVEFGYYIATWKLLNDQQIPSSHDQKGNDNVIQPHVWFGPYPTTYSSALWFTPSLC